MADSTPPQPLVWTDDLVSSFWDHHSSNPKTYFTYQHGHHLVAFLPELRSCHDVLDYGCGGGHLLDALLDAGIQPVTGADVSPASIADVRRRFDGRPGFAGAHAIDQLRAQGRTFDAVLCCEVVEHLYDEQLEAVLADLASMLADGGVAVLTTPNDEDLAASEVYCPVSNVLFHRWQHVRSWTAATLGAALARHGLSVVRTAEVDLSRTPQVDRLAAAIDRVRGVLGRRATPPHLVVVATRAERT